MRVGTAYGAFGSEADVVTPPGVWAREISILVVGVGARKELTVSERRRHRDGSCEQQSHNSHRDQCKTERLREVFL